MEGGEMKKYLVIMSVCEWGFITGSGGDID